MEFALIVPLLLILTLGLIQYGVILNAIVTLSHVSREAGRYAAVNGLKPSIDDSMRTYIRSVATNSRLTLTDANITFSPAENTTVSPTNRRQYQSITVNITYNLNERRFLPTTFFGVRIFSATKTVSTLMMLE